MTRNIEEINQQVKNSGIVVEDIFQEIEKKIVGQKYLTTGLMLGLLTGEHVLVEGVPGLAKTTAVKSFAQSIGGSFKRIQFTPDLLPADVIGTQIYQPKTGDFQVRKGPLFANIILADEINRAPAKVQSALLESMQERQITIADKTWLLEHPFLVMATQNPIEQEGTYPLPEAQLDRFMLKLKVSYPTKSEEKEIVRRIFSPEKDLTTNPVTSPENILKTQKIVEQIYIDDNLQNYIVNVVTATRNPTECGLHELKNMIQFGASPRATIYLNRASKAYAFIQGRGYVVPQDIKTIGPDVLRHRIILSYEAEAENLISDQIIQKVFDTIEVP
tara:strand:- start:608 stop:1600 length:993 start_codon:yes stop_codon:yes gene_type:complete